ncbi:MAG: hypothetical protein AAFR79_08375 [Pseudomonadota bacterium]
MASQQEIKAIHKAFADFEQVPQKDMSKIMELSDKINKEKAANVKKSLEIELGALSMKIKKAAKSMEAAIAKVAKNIHKDDKSMNQELNNIQRHMKAMMPGKSNIKVTGKVSGNKMTVTVKP